MGKKKRTAREEMQMPDEQANKPDADRLYQQAVQACNRIIRELDEQIDALTHKED